MSLFFMFGWPARWCFSAKQKTHRRLPAMGCLISVNLVYGSNLPSPATCVTPIPHSHAARFGIQFTLAMMNFIVRTGEIYPTSVSGQWIIYPTEEPTFNCGGPGVRTALSAWKWSVEKTRGHGCPRSCHAAAFRRLNDSTVQGLSQHLHMPEQVFFRPNSMIRTATVITAAFALITSNAPSRMAKPIRAINTPGTLWQKQQHFLFSQHFFSSDVSITDSFPGRGFGCRARPGKSSYAAALDAAKSLRRWAMLLKNS